MGYPVLFDSKFVYILFIIRFSLFLVFHKRMEVDSTNHNVITIYAHVIVLTRKRFLSSIATSQSIKRFSLSAKKILRFEWKRGFFIARWYMHTHENLHTVLGIIDLII